MIADKGKIDDLAVYIQYMNAPRGRIRSRRFSRTDALIQALPRVTAPLSGIWGGRDAGAYPYLKERKRVLNEIHPGLRFDIIPGAGHWVAYEAADRFNPILAEIIGS
jgi:2-hydroxy-6-oxonona-2,4-dienedioate hydrolase